MSELTRDTFVGNKTMLEEQVQAMNKMLMDTDPKDFARYEEISKTIKSHLFIISLQQIAIDSYDTAPPPGEHETRG